MRTAALLSLATLAVACADHRSTDGGETTERAEASSRAAETPSQTDHYSVATTALTGAVALAQRATGVLLAPRYFDGKPVIASDGTPIRSTCGVTFVDRTHAITAAHCADDVDVPDPPARPLEVELIDVSPTSNWPEAMKLTGTFPAYTHAPITTGYTKTTLVCTIVNRCSYGDYKCPPLATASGADIMRLECPGGLPADREPVAVAPTDAERGPVKLFWFQELYDAPLVEPPLSDAAARDLFAHYSVADSSGARNFHYFGGGRNQLLPLVSSEWANGIARSRLGRDSNTVWTDLFGCHGTSGSGVMELDPKTGRYQLLGVIATASSEWGFARLCTDLATHSPGVDNLSYTASEFTREMASLAN